MRAIPATLRFITERCTNYYGDGDLEKAFALLYKSRLQGEMGERQDAIANALKALEILEDYPQEARCRLLLYNSLGGMVCRQQFSS